jgi:hypothetical protein
MESKMKNFFKIITLVIFSAQALYAASPAIRINNIKMQPSPLASFEDNGEGTLTFNIYESNDVAVPETVVGDVNTEIIVDFNKIKLLGDDLSNVSGDINTYFTIAIENDNKALRFTQKSEIPASHSSTVTIKIEVTENAEYPTSNKAGALVNISASTGASGDGSVYVFTEASDERNVPTPTLYTLNDTTDTTPTISGTCTTGATVTVQVDGTDITPTVECVDGEFTMTPDTPLTKGTHRVTAKQANDDGESPISEEENIEIQEESQGAISVNPINDTFDTTPSISGTCTPDANVTVQVDGSDIEPSVVCASNGTFIVVPDTALSTGTHSVKATQDGQNSGQSGAESFLISDTPTDGTDGADGDDGTDGTNGTNGTNGEDGEDGDAGTDGTNGTDGTDGADGADGDVDTAAIATSTPTPTPTSTVTSTVTSNLESPETCDTDISTSNGSALNATSMLLMMILTGLIGLVFVRKEEIQ